MQTHARARHARTLTHTHARAHTRKHASTHMLRHKPQMGHVHERALPSSPCRTQRPASPPWPPP